jgi:hypothetical protein
MAFDRTRAPGATVGLFAGLAGLAGLASGLSACRGHASADDCHKMTEHYVELAAHEASGAAAMSPGQLAAVREIERGLKRAEPSFRRVEDHCADVTRTEVSCAIDSSSTKDWEGCLPDAGR